MKKINERMQGSLKEEVSKANMMIREKSTGAKRGQYEESERVMTIGTSSFVVRGDNGLQGRTKF